MKTFDVQSVEIGAPSARVFDYVADAGRLPEWTHAFRRVSGSRAWLETPAGEAEIHLVVDASPPKGTIDWTLTFADGTQARAFSRVVSLGEGRALYSFVLLPPPVPLAALEGALEAQSRVLREELGRLRRILEEGR